MEQKLKDGIDVLHGCALTGAEINAEKCEFFEGYAKACIDIKRLIDDVVTGKPMPVRWRQSNEPPE